jgi:hypothetical protein
MKRILSQKWFYKLLALVLIASVSILLTTLAPAAPAQATWTDFIPAIGIYVNFNGKQFLYVLVHSRNEAAGWVWDLVKQILALS